MKGMINNKCNNKVKKQISIFLAVLILSFPIALAAEISKPLTYDPNGNIVQDTDKYYEYDSLNQLTKVRENNQDGRILEEYVYGSDGDRIKKVTHKNDNSQTTTYYVDGNFIRVVNSSGTYDTKYYYNDGQLIAEEKPDGSKNYYHPDHLGSTNLITDQIAQVVEETSYLPFGEAFEGGESRFTFTGKERDSTDLMYYGARYYSPLLKSFTQPDTIIQDIYDPQTLNRYAYVRNNPIKYTDPTGNVAWLAPMAVGATIGALVGGGISLGYQLWQNGGNFGQVDWGAVGKSTLIGAVGGATFGLVSSAGAAAIGAAKLSGISALLAEGGTIAVGGMTSGQAYRATENVLEGRDVTEGLGRPEDMMLDAGSALLGWGAGRGISIASGKSGKSLTSNPSQITLLLMEKAGYSTLWPCDRNR
ncbi:MAG: RHS repeat-associated core domain-containing protein [Nanoarchaeota archaeon]|nr:RHS repeat-associated core domain-containing protein [Nanoarchaeota archaeon]